VLGWDGSAWVTQGTFKTFPVTSLCGFSSTDVWAVGLGDTMLHWDGKVWSPIKPPNTWSLEGIFCRSPSDIWVVGQSGQILRGP